MLWPMRRTKTSRLLAYARTIPLLAVLSGCASAPASTVPEATSANVTVTPLADGRSFEGPRDHFTGHVRVESLFAPAPPGRASGAMVHFDAGARTAWHTHPLGQTLVITSGVGWVQSESQDRITVHPGDVVRIPPNVRHWHGASATEPMSHVAVAESVDGEVVEWMELVADATYLGREAQR